MSVCAFRIMVPLHTLITLVNGNLLDELWPQFSLKGSRKKGVSRSVISRYKQTSVFSHVSVYVDSWISFFFTFKVYFPLSEASLRTRLPVAQWVFWFRCFKAIKTANPYIKHCWFISSCRVIKTNIKSHHSFLPSAGDALRSAAWELQLVLRR